MAYCTNGIFTGMGFIELETSCDLTKALSVDCTTSDGRRIVGGYA